MPRVNHQGRTTPRTRSSSSSVALRGRDGGVRRGAVRRLHNAYFGRAGDFVRRYCVTFDRVMMHLFHARRLVPGLLLRHVSYVEDLLLVVACLDGDTRAWSDFADHFERALSRRNRDGSEDLDAMVEVRQFIAMMRRDALTGDCLLEHYAGTRPLRTWLAEALARARLEARRSAYVLDPADSCCGMPLRFVRNSG